MTLTLLQWNIWYKEDIHHIAEFLKHNPADIICLQELTVGSPDQVIKNTPEFIARSLGYNYFHKEIPIEDTDGTKMMFVNGVFSKFPIISSRFVWINEPAGSGGYSDEFRAYIEAAVDVNGTKLTVGTTHMSYTHKFEPSEGKKAEADMLLTEIKKHNSNYIFTGDLNALPDSYTISSLSEILQNAGPKMTQKTWTTKPFSYNGFEANSIDWRLDYIFATKDLSVAKSEIIRTDYSDHLPIRVEFEI